MNVYFTEQQTPGLRLGLRCQGVLSATRSAYQEVAVLQTETYGRMLTLDDMVMTTEADEFVYHEMLVHPALVTCPRPRRVLIVGGGDGGAVREVLRHPGVERVVLAELDGEVVRVSREHLPRIAGALGDPRVEIRIGDGVAYLRQSADASFDVILVDSPDPIGPAEGLFRTDFYAEAYRVLGLEGVLAAQSESPFLHGDLITAVQERLRGVFPRVGLYWAVIPTYPGAMWTFSIATKGTDPVGAPAERASDLPTRYWSPDVHRAAFALPPFVQRLVGGAPDA